MLVFSIILESINPLIFSKLELKLSFSEINFFLLSLIWMTNVEESIKHVCCFKETVNTVVVDHSSSGDSQFTGEL